MEQKVVSPEVELVEHLDALVAPLSLEELALVAGGCSTIGSLQ